MVTIFLWKIINYGFSDQNFITRLTFSPRKSTKGKRFKILSPKYLLQRFPISLAQVDAGNTSESLLNEICQIFHFLHGAKQIPK